jgi:hypothetical protein
MENEPSVTAYYLGKSTGPTPEMLAAAPYESFAFCTLALAFVLFSLSSGVLAIKARAAGSWLTSAGLLVMFLYFVFQSTVAQDAELRYGPWADAVSVIAYGFGGLLVAVGYARLALATLRAKRSR